MARRRKKDQFDPVQSLVYLLMLGSFFGMYNLTKTFVAASIAAGCVLGVYISVIYVLNKQRTERLKRSGIADIDKMDGRQFELYLGHLFRGHGYIAEVTQSAGDYGADLIISRGAHKIVVQAKRYSKNVGLKAVQEVYTAMNHYNASEAWVVTNSDYTEQAYNLAKSNGVRLINRPKLINMILNMNSQSNTTSSQPIKEESKSISVPVPVIAIDNQVVEESLENDECPNCGYLLIKRKGKKGEFYGCSNFPNCRHTISINESTIA